MVFGSIFNFSILFDGKVNLGGPFGRSKFPIVFKSARKNGNFYAKSAFDSISAFGVTVKQMVVNTWNVHWMFILAFPIHEKIFKIFWLFWAVYRYT